MKVFQGTDIDDLDAILCKLNSLGTILVHLTTMECQNPDMTSLTDLGKIIQEQTMTGLDVIGDGKEITDPFLKLDIEKAGKVTEVSREEPPSPKVSECSRKIGFLPAKRKGERK